MTPSKPQPTSYKLCALAAAQNIIDNQRYAELAIPPQAVPLIEWAWNQEPPALYGRFDISWAGAASGQPPKLLEYNADTPTSLVEASVVQWSWMEDARRDPPGGKPDQFNSIHDRLIAKWKDIKGYCAEPIYFTALQFAESRRAQANKEAAEDHLTVTYLRDTATQAGLETRQIALQDIGWNDEHQAFVDLDDTQITTLFKLYPWESMLREEFGPHALDTYRTMTWIEPIWKMLLSNKGLLPILWQLYPNHELLLESHFDTPPATIEPVATQWSSVPNTGFGSGTTQPYSTLPQPTALARSQAMRNYVRKPLLSREGSNITLIRDGQIACQTEGPYTGPQILQALAPEATFPDPQNQPRHPILGLWMIDQECGGMGIRESRTPITDNLSSFVPHYFV